MNDTEQNKRLKWNSILWVLAMVLPAFCSIALAGTKFPWPMIFPMLLMGPMLASNRMLTQAAAKKDADSTKPNP